VDKTANIKFGITTVNFILILGRLLYSSAPYDYVVTSVSWSPNGEYFAVGAYGMLRLCDKTGWTYSYNKIECGSAEKITWSPDGTLCSAACGDGSVIFGEVVDKKVSFNNW
jgi:intraflagellar transport protein 80